MGKFHALALAPLLAGGCATDTAYRPDQLIRVEHPAYVAELVKPETAEFGDRHARFVEGGWLVGLTPKATGENIFYDITVIPGHNTRGLPLEFRDALPLDGDRLLRPGVGIVSREGKSRFDDVAVERYPWFSSVARDGKVTTVRFHQFAPRHYFYTRTVSFDDASKRVVFEDELRNLSPATLASRIFFHPFFKSPKNAAPWCRIDTKPDFANPERPPLPSDTYVEAKVPDGKSWFVCGAGGKPLAALWVEGAKEVGYWREPRPEGQVFAVEPFVDIAVPPWETHKWTWGIEVP